MSWRNCAPRTMHLRAHLLAERPRAPAPTALERPRPHAAIRRARNERPARRGIRPTAALRQAPPSRNERDPPPRGRSQRACGTAAGIPTTTPRLPAARSTNAPPGAHPGRWAATRTRRSPGPAQPRRSPGTAPPHPRRGPPAQRHQTHGAAAGAAPDHGTPASTPSRLACTVPPRTYVNREEA